MSKQPFNMPISLALVLLAHAFAPPCGLPDEFRTWVDSSGKHRVEAVLLAVEDGAAKLKKRDGRVISVPIARLSASDQARLRIHSKPQAAGKPNPKESPPRTARSNAVAPPATSNQTTTEQTTTEQARATFSVLDLIKQASVKRELHISSSQSRMIQRVPQLWQQKLKSLSSQKISEQRYPTPEEQERGFNFLERVTVITKQQAAERAEAGMRWILDQEILKPDQSDRLRQIDLQLRGVAALNDISVRRALKLTEEQRQRITQATLKESNSRWADLEPRIKAILTPEQNEKLSSLFGETFRGKVNLP